METTTCTKHPEATMHPVCGELRCGLCFEELMATEKRVAPKFEARAELSTVELAAKKYGAPLPGAHSFPLLFTDGSPVVLSHDRRTGFLVEA